MKSNESHRAIIAVGSNTPDAEANFDKAMDALSSNANIILAQSTRRVWTEPIASKGITAQSPKFLNCLLSIDTQCSVDQLSYILKEVETTLGATKIDKQKGNVKIDLDILSYDNDRHHIDDWSRNYIQTLIKEIENTYKHS